LNLDSTHSSGASSLSRQRLRYRGQNHWTFFFDNLFAFNGRKNFLRVQRFVLQKRLREKLMFALKNKKL
jgi:hypothetical protein